jgi:FtsP/CotA-like multicopper oxidase with cupredoxin domain
MTINGGIPGPTLRFREGDIARIRVHNKMSVETSIHWHGLLVPPGMDGVPYVSFPPIKAGATFTYEFPIRQSGTYWYHSHTSLQEQSGVYGSIVIENRTLKRGSEWFATQKGSGQSILGAARLGMLGDYYKRELQRMPAMDISDVAYDRFLANGKPETTLSAGPGETVRLRIIDGSATTYFHLEFAGGPMTVVSADGQDVEPIKENRFLIGVAETYDVVVQVPASGAYEFRATAHDGSGYASVWLGSGERHPAPDLPKPNLYFLMPHMRHLSLKRIFSLTPAGTMGFPDSEVEAGKFDRPGMMGMGSMDMDGMHGMDHGAGASGMHNGGMDHPSGMSKPPPSPGTTMNHGRHPIKRTGPGDHTLEVDRGFARTGKKYGTAFRLLGADVSSSKILAVDGMDPVRPWPPYAKLRATKPTAFPKDKPVREIRLTLDGDMERYIWLLDNKPLSESDSIRIREGEIVRFIMINRTMMHHPHFFRVINAQGDYSPLKHTVNVAPMSTTVIEFYSDEVGDWFFHCHLLYHMKAGMARVVHYEDFPLDPRLAAIQPNLYRDPWYFW